MEWTKDSLKEERTKAKLSQTALADELGVHFRTVQNWEKGTTPIPVSVLPALDKLFGETQDVVPREEYNKVVAALNSATELNKKLTDIIQSSI
ncbi:MAG: helix-turn-helix domain-containing protein [Prevotella sp.]|nr:helix-turn-helix domain-containing protein [Prevotella sp.]